MRRRIFEADHEAFRLTVREFLQREVAPDFGDWERAGRPPRDFYRKAAELGLLGIQVPEEHGGGGVESFKFNCVLNEEVHAAHLGIGSLRVQMDIVLPYFLAYATEDQRRRWLPGIARGDLLTAIGMTEPGAGSDLAGIRTSAVDRGDHYLVNGAKTFISGGGEADLVVLVVRTSPATGRDRRAGISLLVVERGTDGFTVGRNLDKLGLKAQDTSELFFEDVVVDKANLLGEEGRGFDYLTSNLPQERLSISIASQAMAAAALLLTTRYVAQRELFGRRLGDFQNTKFVLAECATEVEAGQAMCDLAVEELDAGALTAVDAAKVKLFTSETQGRVVDRCLQLHGGYGFMNEYPISRMYADARVSRIFGGSSEVMKGIISKSLEVAP